MVPWRTVSARAASAPASSRSGPVRRSRAAKSGPGSSAGREERQAPRRLLPALLDVVADELLGVVLEDLVDLVRAGRRARPSASRPRSDVGRGLLDHRLLACAPVRWLALLLTFCHVDCSPNALNRVQQLRRAWRSHPAELLDMFGCSLERIHHRDAAQRVGAQVEDERVPVGGDHRVAATAPGTGPGSRPGCRGAARSPPRPPASSVDEALHVQPGEEGALGAQVVVLQVERGQPVVVPVAGRGGPGSPRAAGSLATQSSWPATGRRVGLEAVEHLLPAVEHRLADRLVAEAARGPRSSAYLRASAEELPLDLEGRGRAAVGQLERARQGRGRARPGGWPGPGRPGSGRRPAKASSSIMARTRAVVPTFKKVATSARLASPTMTCRRRYAAGRRAARRGC